MALSDTASGETLPYVFLHQEIRNVVADFFGELVPPNSHSRRKRSVNRLLEKASLGLSRGKAGRFFEDVQDRLRAIHAVPFRFADFSQDL